MREREAIVTEVILSYKLEDKKELIINFIKENLPKEEIARQIGCNIKTLNSYLLKWGVKYHGNQGVGITKHL